MNKEATLVIGGLGLKGLANIGVLQAISESDIPIKRIVASGISSIIGAQFALGRDMNLLTDELVSFFAENDRYLWGLQRLSGMPRRRTRRVRDSFAYFLRERLFCQANFSRISILPWDILDSRLKTFFGDVHPSDFQVPLAVSAIDLSRKQEVLLEEEDLIMRLKAGLAFPGLFPPVHHRDREYAGSTFYCELPLSTLSTADAPIIVSDIPSSLSTERPGNVIETLARVDEIRSMVIKKDLLARADRLFSLQTVKGFQWGNYRQIHMQVDRAYQEMKTLMDESG